MLIQRKYIGATHGATLARRELEGDAATQTILFIGDGSLYASFLSKFITNVNMIVASQMTVQELSAMIRSNIKPIIFVINNGVTATPTQRGWVSLNIL